MKSTCWASKSGMTLAAMMLSAIAIEGSTIASDGYECLYEDDGVVCEGFSPEKYQQRIQQHTYQQRTAYIENQRAIANQAIADQRAFERTKQARRARFDKEARRRDELIAKRKAKAR